MAENKAGKSAKQEDEEMVFEPSSDSDGEEDADLADIEDGLAARLKQCKEKLTLCQKERQEYLDGWQRAKADFLNNKKRLEAEREREIEWQTAQFIERLLPLCDSFALALAEFKKEGGEGGNWRVGVEQIYNQLAAVLKSYNVETLEPHDVPFDPHFHEAVSEITVADPAQDHTVLEVLQKGYAIGERLIRPTKVVVGMYRTAP